MAGNVAQTGTSPRAAVTARRRPSRPCGRFAPFLEPFDRGTLGSAAAAELRAHLGRCASCRRELRDRRAMRSLLSHMRVPPPPPDLWERIKAALDREGSGDGGGGFPREA